MADNNIIFCDGACSGNPGPGGWACIVSSSGIVSELGGREDNTTNNRMEMTAALKALEKIAPLKCAFTIYTDSSYLIKGITGWVFGWQKNDWKTSDGKDVANRDLWQKLVEMQQLIGHKNIRWTHVPAHSGIPANERVDEIAVSFAKQTPITLYQGPFQNYTVSLEVILQQSSPKQKPVYLSFIDGVLERHSTWPECEKRVKGKNNAKFKKVASAQEEKEILLKWGIK